MKCWVLEEITAVSDILPLAYILLIWYKSYVHYTGRQRNSQMELKINDSAILAQNAHEIKKLGKRMIDDLIKIGKLLVESKNVCRHGNWEQWLKNEFGWTQMTATRYMNV